MKKEITKLISIGSNCIATDIINSIGIRVPSPIDNFNGVNIWKSHFLFSHRLFHILFKEQYKIRKSTNTEQEKYFYCNKVYRFNEGIEIVHNDFNDIKFTKALKKRMKSFHIYYLKSYFNKSLWYVYSLNYEDTLLSYVHLTKIKKSLPRCCRERLICIGIRAKNKLFEKFFNYYIEFDSEDKYIWHDKEQAEKIFTKTLENKYGITIKKN